VLQCRGKDLIEKAAPPQPWRMVIYLTLALVALIVGLRLLGVA
jgi:hypothetical protein